MSIVAEIGARSRAVRQKLACATTSDKNFALQAVADALRANTDEILAANKLDMQNAAEKGIPAPMQARLKLSAEKIDDIARAVEYVIGLPDPVGIVHSGSTRPNGLKIQKVSVPIGVIAIIYESRPNVTADAAILCLKSGNACILRGGSEAINSNVAIAKIMRRAIATVGLPEDAIQILEDTSHDSAAELMRLNDYVDLLIPRGSSRLIKTVVSSATVPVIETGAGVCHVYIDKDADLDMAVVIAHTGKISYPAACNSVETLLVHEDVARAFLPKIKKVLSESKVEIFACPRTRAIIDGVQAATDESFFTEYNEHKINIKVVSDIDEAMKHIEHHGTHHSDAIVTDNYRTAGIFTSTVDSAAVYVNASTRFTDGGEFGMGAEIGISTQKLHVRGPMGLNELTTTKYIIHGDGQIR